MSEQFALCWNNFTDNITSGFQDSRIRGDFCDATLGKVINIYDFVV